MNVVRVFTNKALLKRAHPKTHFTSHLFFLPTWVLQTLMGKPNKGKGRNPNGHECNPATARDGALPHFPSLLTCCFASSIYQSLNWRSLHSCVTTSLGKSFLSKLGQLIVYDCPCWSCSCLAAPFSVGWMLAEGAQRWTLQRPRCSPSNTE